MLIDFFKWILPLAASFCLLACDKDNDRCNCVDKDGENSVVDVEDQDCSDLSTDQLTCFPKD